MAMWNWKRIAAILGLVGSAVLFHFICTGFDQTSDIALFVLPWLVGFTRWIFSTNENFMCWGGLLMCFVGAKYWMFLVRVFRSNSGWAYALIGLHFLGVAFQHSHCWHTHNSYWVDGLEVLVFALFLLSLKRAVQGCRKDSVPAQR